METKETISEWAIAHHRDLNLRVKNFCWISKWLPGWVDMGVKIQVLGRDWEGRATARNGQQALTKAFTEAVERCAAAVAGLDSTNGVAGHESDELAAANATAEIIERDRFLWHFYSDNPLMSLEYDRPPISSEIFSAYEMCRKLGVDVEFAEAQAVGRYRTYACFFKGINYKNPFGLILGLGCSTESSWGLEKSFLEGLRNLAWVIDRQPEPLSFSQFAMSNLRMAERHRRLALHTDYLKYVEGLISHARRYQSVEEPYAECRLLSLPCLLKDAPVKICAVKSEKTGNFFWGAPNKEASSWIRSFNSITPQFNRSEIPHPIG